ncbi:MAG TPA: FecR domain-containing protein [Bacteroidales bacterium]|nr:FecR domain-containing protein [Bacteroidales bacterium]
MSTENYKEDIDRLILAFLTGELISTEKEELKEWINASASNKAYFKQMNRLWKSAALSSQNSKYDANRAFQRVQYHIFEQNRALRGTGRKTQRVKNTLFTEFMKWAAVILISLVTGAAVYYILSDYSSLPDKNAISRVEVPLGAKSKVLLPDGTEVWLNAGSKLTYSADYGKKDREVSLTGEGYFKVAHNPAKPFIVEASKISITALGTEFNVKAYPDENMVETILVKGSVVVKKPETIENNHKYASQSIVLKPGQKARIYKTTETEAEYVKIPEKERNDTPIINKTRQTVKAGEIKLQASNPGIETSWKDERWIIKGENLDELLVLLSRRFNVRITLLNKELTKYQFSGTIENETPEQVFKIMSLTIPMSYAIEKGDVKITLNRKLEEKYKSAYKKQMN